MQDLAAQYNRPGLGKLAEVLSGISVIDDRIGGRAFAKAR
jgi:hypothetical protein